MANLRSEGGKVRFLFTMNMQSRSGNPTHQVIGVVHGVTNLDQMLDILQDQDFITVEEFYRQPEGGYYSRGNTILNTVHIGKVKVDAST